MPVDYEDFDVEAFAVDPFFREWVLEPTDRHHMFWEDYLSTYPYKEDVVVLAKEIVLGVVDQFDTADIEPESLAKHFDVLVEQADVSNSRDHGGTALYKLRKVAVRKWAVAASWLLIAASVVWLYQSNKMLTHSTTFGEWKTVMLPDESVVRLNANSQIKLASSWKEGENRSVWLKGEAFFDVKKELSTGAKFTVITEDLSVEVLGTSFNVTTRSQKTGVYLEEGSIRLNLGDQVEMMQPGNFVEYSVEQPAVIEKEEDARNEHDEWQTGVLVLKKKSVLEITEKLEEIYGVEVQIENEKLYEEVLTLRIPLEDLQVVVPILEAALTTTVIVEKNNLLVFK